MTSIEFRSITRTLTVILFVAPDVTVLVGCLKLVAILIANSLLKLWTNWRAKRRYIWKELFEAGVADLQAGLPLSRAKELRDHAAKLKNEAEASLLKVWPKKARSWGSGDSSLIGEGNYETDEQYIGEFDALFEKHQMWTKARENESSAPSQQKHSRTSLPNKDELLKDV
jgi:hypothetical protein